MKSEYGNNEAVPMTRRFPPLRLKNKKRDAKIANKIIYAWDTEHNENKVWDIFLQENHLLSNYRYWELLRSIWIICGNNDRLDQFRKYFNSNRKQKHYFSTSEEFKRLRELPGGVWVHRACNLTGRDMEGFSYTLSMEYAQQYMVQFEKSHVISKYIDKSEIYALIERNQEDEILIL